MTTLAEHTWPRTRRALPLAALGRHVERALPLAWAIALVVVIGFAPAANAEAATPLWADITLGAWWLALVAAVAFWVRGLPRAALTASLLSASCGVVLGYGCRATAHHVGSWWLVELGVFGGLAVMSAATLAARR